jgi:hypothetical protein
LAGEVALPGVAKKIAARRKAGRHLLQRLPDQL